LGSYLEGSPNDGVYASPNLALYSYVYQSPIKFADPDGKCPWCFGALVGAGLDVTVQVAMISTGHQPEGFSLKSVIISGAAGAVGIGVAAKAAEVGGIAARLLAEVGGDAAVDMGSKAAKGEEITVKGVALDVVAGQAGGKLFGRAAKGSAANSEEAKLLDKAANRAERIANNPKVGRPEARARQANEARGAQKGYIGGAEVRAGTVGSSLGENVSDAGQKMLEPNKQEPSHE
jgi:hypothetical protein